MTDRLYFRQLLAGRDFARQDPVAQQMRNFVYLIGDRETRECVVVDPAWGVDDLIAWTEQDEMHLVGALATHYHPDHIGGDLMGMAVVQGVAELLEKLPIKVHCQKAETEWIRRTTDIGAMDLEAHESGDVLQVGEISVRFIHTPGHTPGSQCFLVEGNRLVAGDTLFLDGCGRTDFPGGDSEEMYKSLHQRLAHLPDDTILFPGHLYSAEAQASLGETRARNYVFQVRSLEDWKQFMG
ncbi:MAG: MBL fold metallo-hydrolase [Planctomycetes bacterium]|nr:MBL fold metallo-hydrolase [Planctomycetota bacterium]MCB9891922.1 MBL fold metallo-hydrolase [Planctomycetota bacterium]